MYIFTPNEKLPAPLALCEVVQELCLFEHIFQYAFGGVLPFLTDDGHSVFECSLRTGTGV